MTVSTNLKAEAADLKAGMTLDELASFVQAAMTAGLPGGTRIHGAVNIRTGIKRLETRA
jgi:hypothetical protein